MRLMSHEIERLDMANRKLRQKLRQARLMLKSVEETLSEKISCNHPGCCCVCGHQGRCPEDGPTAGLSDAITD
jgi:hypothetical protein